MVLPVSGALAGSVLDGEVLGQRRNGGGGGGGAPGRVDERWRLFASESHPYETHHAEQNERGAFFGGASPHVAHFWGWCPATRASERANAARARLWDNETTRERKTRSFSAAASYPLARTVCTGVCSTHRRPRQAGERANGRAARQGTFTPLHSH